MSLLAAEALSIGYRFSPRILDELGIEIPSGRFVALLGPNGSGKSSLLRTLAGLQPPLSGNVSLDGRPLYGRRAVSVSLRARSIAVVLTEVVLPGLLTGADLVATGRLPYRPLFGPLDETDRRVIEESLELVEASHLASRRIGEVSDGERQRLMLARALAQRPRILLMDEPGAFLDPPHQAALFIMLRELVTTQRLEAVLVATHQLSLAIDHADPLWPLSGRGVEDGPPQEAENAINRAFALPGVRFSVERGTFNSE